MGTLGRALRDADAIGYLAGLGIEAGAPVSVEGVSPFDGPVAVRVGGKVHHLGRRLAAAVHVGEGGAVPEPLARRRTPR